MQPMLRKAVLIYGVIALAIALLLLSAGAFLPLGFYLLVNGFVVVGAILLQRGQYRVHFRWARRQMQPTGERVVDPTTGEIVEVVVDPKTGSRNVAPLRRVDAGPPAEK